MTNDFDDHKFYDSMIVFLCALYFLDPNLWSFRKLDPGPPAVPKSNGAMMTAQEPLLSDAKGK